MLDQRQTATQPTKRGQLREGGPWAVGQSNPLNFPSAFSIKLQEKSPENEVAPQLHNTYILTGISQNQSLRNASIDVVFAWHLVLYTVDILHLAGEIC